MPTCRRCGPCWPRPIPPIRCSRRSRGPSSRSVRMHSLRELQTRTLDALLHGGAGPAAAALLRSGRGPAPARRLQVYRNNLVVSLTAALEAVYPVVARLVGAGFFRQVARAFIAE